MKSIFIMFFVFVSPALMAVEGEQRWIKKSEAAHFAVTIYPQEKIYAIGDYHTWIVEIRNALGKPVENAQVGIGGGMLGHGHGLPSQPKVTRYLGGGKYLVEGMLFNMAGKWTLIVGIQTPKVSDRVLFDINLAF